MKRITHITISSFIALAGFLGGAGVVSTLSMQPVAAAANTNEARNGVDAIGGNQNGNSASDFTALLKSIINILLFVIGSVAVIMIIVGGIRYTTSNGDSSQVTGAKNTIMYAIVGLVVAIMAFSIVNFVLNHLN